MLPMFDEQAWDERAGEAAKKQPLKGLRHLPKMPGITEKTANGLKRKSLWWMITRDAGGRVRKHVLRHPFRYGLRLLRSLLRRRAYTKRDGDFYCYGVSSLDQFQQELQNPNSLLVIGFSYCHKPFECPSGRFTPNCIADPNSLICQQCFIGKAMHALPKDGAIPLVIPTVHYVGEKILEIMHQHPDKKVLFLITACELTLEMFGDYGNMAGVRGLGVRLDGRICNTMEAFAKSEEGIKPGLTVVLPPTQAKILELLAHRRDGCLPEK